MPSNDNEKYLFFRMQKEPGTGWGGVGFSNLYVYRWASSYTAQRSGNLEDTLGVETLRSTLPSRHGGVQLAA
jgi:hypothetical protein